MRHLLYNDERDGYQGMDIDNTAWSILEANKCMCIALGVCSEMRICIASGKVGYQCRLLILKELRRQVF